MAWNSWSPAWCRAQDGVPKPRHQANPARSPCSAESRANPELIPPRQAKATTIVVRGHRTDGVYRIRHADRVDLARQDRRPALRATAHAAASVAVRMGKTSGDRGAFWW